MVELDARKTSDGQLVLRHDETIDRTITDMGRVEDWTLDSLKTLFLLDGLGIPTPHRIPTLAEALQLARGQILVNLDKSYSIFAECWQVVQSSGTLDQVVIKGKKTRREVEEEFGQYLDQVFFMPIVDLTEKDAAAIVQDYLDHCNPWLLSLSLARTH